MKKKEHLTSGQRYEIHALLKAEHSQAEIARVVGKDKSVISREIRRNGGKRGYSAARAQKMAEERKERYGRARKFTEAVRKEVERWLRQEQYSPEQIVGLARREGRPMVSHERIYQYIRADKAAGGDLYKQLRHRLKHRRRPAGERIPIKNRVSIEERPEAVAARSRFGDWEADTIVGKGGHGVILTAVERTTGFLLMEPLPQGKNAEGLADALIELLLPYKDWVHTITTDNGTEFAQHQRIARRLQAGFYFAHPYSSWERGLNEYTNRLVRQYIPKGTSFGKYNRHDIKQIQYKINRRPREKLGFDTPKRLFFLSLQEKVALVT